MVTVNCPKFEVIEMEDLPVLSIAQNKDIHIRLRGIFRKKVEGKGKLLTVGNCLINCGFGNIPVQESRTDASKKTLDRNVED